MRIGLALGSGAARGIAHIGVLRALEVLRIPVHCLAGSSMGAVIAAAYSAGLSLSEMEEIASSTTRTKILKLFIPTLSKTGIISGRKIEEFFKDKIGDAEFRDLKIPLAIETTDLETGELVTLTNGSVIKALRASISIPLLFSPIEIDGKILVDGGMVSPIPIRAVRDLGADFIIAVNVIPRPQPFSPSKSPLSQKAIKKISKNLSNYNLLERFAHLLPEDIEDQNKLEKQGFNLIDVILKSYNISRQRLVQYQLRAENPDLLIEPDIGEIAGSDFYKGTQIIDGAYRSSLKALKKLMN